MFTDAHTLPANQILETEVCIVGAGAAGITLAREFARATFRVILLESGGLKFKHRTQFLYQAQNRGRPYPALEFTRRRQFGGSTVTWFGRCRPLDEIDFETRPGLPYSGWPFSKSHLNPFYTRAQAYCQLQPDGYDVPSDYFQSDEIETKKFQFSPPTNFAQAYQHEIDQAGNIHIVLHANAIHIGLDSHGSKVDHLQCKTLAGKLLQVRAKIFVLAASALENTRLLLASREVHPNGIGNQEDLLGRFFMEHPHFFSGVVISIPQDFPKEYLKLNFDSKQKNLGQVSAVGPTKILMEKEGLLNAGAFFVDRPYHKTIEAYYANNSAGFLSVMEILQHTSPPNSAIFKNLMNALRNSSAVAGLLASAVLGRLKRKRSYTLCLQLETMPNPGSRVTLSTKKDALGVPQIALEWKTTSFDIESHRRFESHLYAGLQKAGIRAKRFDHDLAGDGWPVSMRSAKHHMGTTRMHADPRRGVVDADCRVHHVSNLYIAGSSVFPTSGMANPTLTIVALALRLADHIKKELGV